MLHLKRLLMAALFAGPLAVQAAVLNPDNGHYYELVGFDDNFRLDWNEAKAYAEDLTFKGANGYLATLTSVAEDDFVWNLGAQDYFLGAYDVSSRNGSGQWVHNEWHWVTGESFSFANWLPGEPNHWQDGSDATPGNEDYLMYWGAVRGWNDTNVDSSYIENGVLKYTTKGFVVEFAPPASPVPLPAAAWLFLSAAAFFFSGRPKAGPMQGGPV